MPGIVAQAFRQRMGHLLRDTLQGATTRKASRKKHHIDSPLWRVGVLDPCQGTQPGEPQVPEIKLRKQPPHIILLNISKFPNYNPGPSRIKSTGPQGLTKDRQESINTPPKSYDLVRPKVSWEG